MQSKIKKSLISSLLLPCLQSCYNKNKTELTEWEKEHEQYLSKFPLLSASLQSQNLIFSL